MNRLGKGPLDDAKYLGSRPCGFRQVSLVLPYISLCKTCVPQSRGHFWRLFFPYITLCQTYDPKDRAIFGHRDII